MKNAAGAAEGSLEENGKSVGLLKLLDGYTRENFNEKSSFPVFLMSIDRRLILELEKEIGK